MTTGWREVPADRLCVTSGTLAPAGVTRFRVDSPTFRAVTPAAAEPRAQLKFTYAGPTATTRALGSGAIRQQLGLKLRSQDPCNLLYVMWRFEPKQQLVVSIKRNPGLRTSAECGNQGYRNLKPRTEGKLPPITPGASHTLRAESSGETLRVFVDDALVWEGEIGAEALALAGPIGVRSDNVRVEAELSGAPGGSAGACGSGGDEGE
ncbi:MAG TPA: hypothetical protein VGI39_13120 [Polyangiaceae bacterium]|jgi:hypothetical protein